MSYKLCKGINVVGAHNFNSSSSSAQTAELTNEKKKSQQSLYQQTILHTHKI